MIKFETLVKRGQSHIGEKINMLEIVDFEIVQTTTGNKVVYKCLCDCGNYTYSDYGHLSNGHKKSCGCLNKMTVQGNKFNKKYNEYEVFDNIVFVKFSNCDKYFICDLDDWEVLKGHCWLCDDNDYPTTTIEGKTVEIQHLILKTNEIIDHINRCPIDNRKNNLRIVTKSLNAFNSKLRNTNNSGITGVFWDKARNKWCASITVNYKKINLGRFNDINDALKARMQAEIKYFGEVLQR